MPKKTAYSRNGAQRTKPKQKNFELVRPISDENVLETVESSQGEEREEEDSVEIASFSSPEREEAEVEEIKPKAARSSGTKVSMPTAAAVVPNTPAVGGNSSPKSAAARMAARRQAAQKTQRSSSSLITVEHYNYVRKDLIFILILAIIMFGAIIALHFVLGG